MNSVSAALVLVVPTAGTPAPVRDILSLSLEAMLSGKDCELTRSSLDAGTTACEISAAVLEEFYDIPKTFDLAQALPICPLPAHAKSPPKERLVPCKKESRLCGPGMTLAVYADGRLRNPRLFFRQ